MRIMGGDHMDGEDGEDGDGDGDMEDECSVFAIRHDSWIVKVFPHDNMPDLQGDMIRGLKIDGLVTGSEIDW